MEFKYKKVTLFMLTLASFFFLVGCMDKKIDTSTLMDDIAFEVVSINPGLNTDLDVTITMTNNSEYKIVQNAVLYSLTPTSLDSLDSNDLNETTSPFSFMAQGNKLNIKPGESVDLVVSYPNDILQKDFEEPLLMSEMIHFVGYFDKLDDDTRLEFIKSLSLEK